MFCKVLPDVLRDELLSSSALDDLLKVLLPSGTSPNNVGMTNNIVRSQIDVDVLKLKNSWD